MKTDDVTQGKIALALGGVASVARERAEDIRLSCSLGELRGSRCPTGAREVAAALDRAADALDARAVPGQATGLAGANEESFAGADDEQFAGANHEQFAGVTTIETTTVKTTEDRATKPREPKRKPKSE